MMNFSRIFIVVLLFTAFAYGQSDSTIYTLPQLKLELIENKKDVVYDFDKVSNVFVLTDSVLYADPQKYTYSINTRLIKQLLIRDGTYGLKGAAIGAIGGALGLGLSVAILLAARKSEGGGITAPIFPILTLGGAAIGGLLGAIFGLATPYYEIYHVSGDNQKRKSIIEKVFKKHKLK